jgi:hypothetical protein
MIELTPAQQAQLDAIDAQSELALGRMIERYKTMQTAYGVLAIEAMETNLTGPPWSKESLATLATYALRRLAR